MRGYGTRCWIALITFAGLALGFLLLHPSRPIELRHRWPDLPGPEAAAFPAPCASGHDWPVSQLVAAQHRQIAGGRSAAAGTPAIQPLAGFEEVAEGNQTRWIGVHGWSMMRRQGQGPSPAIFGAIRQQLGWCGDACRS
jgi:hypothetical protein